MTLLHAVPRCRRTPATRPRPRSRRRSWARLQSIAPQGILVYAAMRDEVDPARIIAAALAAGIPLAYPLID
ncbi:MAG: hypothetical protein M5U09_19365 [Gammaproteobacteria bacterium]|nr:hypothetical protein [Gammaproteobacteria bacterium]